MTKIELPFDQLAKEYDAWFDQHQAAFQSEVEVLRKVIPNKGDGLEVGVGSGRFAEALGIKTGVEPSKKLGDMARLRGIDVFEGVVEQLPFQNEKFDYVLFNTVLCFLEQPVKAIQEVKRVLKPNGIFIVGMIDGDSFLGDLYKIKKKQNDLFYKDAFFYSVNQVESLLNELGFFVHDIYQTIFSPPEEILTPQLFKAGYGEGGYVVIKGLSGPSVQKSINK